MFVVIEIQNNEIIGNTAYDDKASGEAHFLAVCRETVPGFDKYSQEDIDCVLDNGFEKCGDGSVSFLDLSNDCPAR